MPKEVQEEILAIMGIAGQVLAGYLTRPDADLSDENLGKKYVDYYNLLWRFYKEMESRKSQKSSADER